MKYFIVALVPILMLCDYYLTILGFILYKRHYSRHFKFEEYELNPLFQSSIKKHKWFNLRHMASVALVTICAVFMVSGAKSIANGVEGFFFGWILVTFSAIIGKHLTNILLFLHALKHPDEISGEIYLNYRFQLRVSQYSIVGILCPFIVLLLFNQTSFIWGGVAGLIFLWLIHSCWLDKYNRKTRREGDICGKGKPAIISRFIKIFFIILGWLIVIVVLSLAMIDVLYDRHKALIILSVFGGIVIAIIAVIFFVPRGFRVITVLAFSFIISTGTLLYEELAPTYDDLKAQGKILVDEIEQYHAQNNRYPYSLDKADIILPNTRYGRWVYEAENDGGEFYLHVGDYNLDFFELWWYSTDDKWHLDE